MSSLGVSRNVRVLVHSILFCLSFLSVHILYDRQVRPTIGRGNKVGFPLARRPSRLSDVLRSSDVYTRLFKSTLTLSKLKDAAIGGRLLKPSDDPIGVVGRSMIWRVCQILSIWSIIHSSDLRRKLLLCETETIETTTARYPYDVP
jgi:hypothetical protein